jgi:hypothetical protein
VTVLVEINLAEINRVANVLRARANQGARVVPAAKGSHVEKAAPDRASPVAPAARDFVR